MSDLSTYELEWGSSAQDAVIIRYKFFPHSDRKIIATYSQKHAEKDKKGRKERIAKAEQLLNTLPGSRTKPDGFISSKNAQVSMYSIRIKSITTSNDVVCLKILTD